MLFPSVSSAWLYYYDYSLFSVSKISLRGLTIQTAMAPKKGMINTIKVQITVDRLESLRFRKEIKAKIAKNGYPITNITKTRILIILYTVIISKA